MTTWEILASYPTNIYTVLIGVLVFYWIMVILGALDIEIYSIDADVDVDVDSSHSIPGFVGLLKAFGLLGVPLSVVFSLLFFSAWIIAYFSSLYLLPLFPLGIVHYVLASVILLLSFILSIPITAKIIMPLKRVFVEHNAMSNQDIVGHQCKVTSLEVTDSFGQGYVETTGAGLNVRIRSRQANDFTKGSMVRIIEYNESDNSYEVVSEKEFQSGI